MMVFQFVTTDAIQLLCAIYIQLCFKVGDYMFYWDFIDVLFEANVFN